MQRGPTLAALIAAQVAATGCGYPSFQFGGSSGGAGGSTTAASSGNGSSTAASSSSRAASSSTTTAASSSAAASSGSSSSGAPCSITHLLISQVRSRGAGGATDEFIELYNPTGSDAVLDPGWEIDGRSDSAVLYAPRWIGSSGTIPAYGHYLIVGSGYQQSPASDDTLSDSITDSESLVLSLQGAQVSAICYYHAAASLWDLQNLGYACEGMPVYNPHDDTTSTDSDQSLERKPGGHAGNCVDTDDSASDFDIATPAAPMDAASAPTP